MRYFKNEPNGDVCLYVVDDDRQTISEQKWDENNKVEYNENYGYSNLSAVENYTSIDGGEYNAWCDEINEAIRIGSVPARPPQ